MSEEAADERLMRKARIRALQQKRRRPVTELGMKMNMRLTIARMTIQDLDRKARNTIWEQHITDSTAMLLKTLQEVEEVILEWELEQ